VLHAGEDRLCVVCPVDHPLARKRRITLDSLAGHPLVLTAAGTSVRAVVDAAFEQAGMAPILTCEPMYMMTAVAMVRAGLGLTILPGSSREILAEPSVVARAIDDPRFVRPIALVKKRGRTLPPVTEAFVTAIAPALAGTRKGKGK
jgi:DNA-binding transcriptional LysR family regulator